MATKYKFETDSDASTVTAEVTDTRTGDVTRLYVEMETGEVYDAGAVNDMPVATLASWLDFFSWVLENNVWEDQS